LLRGHPPLNAFLGVPLFDQGFSNMIGMIGIANKPGGYSKDDIDFIEPFVVTCSKPYPSLQHQTRKYPTHKHVGGEGIRANARALARKREA
jgi:GAF domain